MDQAGVEGMGGHVEVEVSFQDLLGVELEGRVKAAVEKFM